MILKIANVYNCLMVILVSQVAHSIILTEYYMILAIGGIIWENMGSTGLDS